MSGEERRCITIRGSVGEFAADEGVTQGLRVGIEACPGADLVTLESVGQDGEIVTVETFLHGGELGVADLQGTRLIQRQGRLAGHRRDDGALEHHGDGEVAGEAHPDRAHTCSPALTVRRASEGHQPRRDGARLATAECAELLRDAETTKHLCPAVGVTEGAVGAEEGRQVDRHATIADPSGETSDVWADAGHLVHHDHTGTVTADIHATHLAEERDGPDGEVGEVVVLGHVVIRHRDPPAMDRRGVRPIW